jgi:hypothetical protein
MRSLDCARRIPQPASGRPTAEVIVKLPRAHGVRTVRQLPGDPSPSSSTAAWRASGFNFGITWSRSRRGSSILSHPIRAICCQNSLSRECYPWELQGAYPRHQPPEASLPRATAGGRNFPSPPSDHSTKRGCFHRYFPALPDPPLEHIHRPSLPHSRRDRITQQPFAMRQVGGQTRIFNRWVAD